MNVVVKKGINVDSDHYVSVVKFRPIPFNGKQNKPVTSKLDTKKLKENENEFKELAKPMQKDFDGTKKQMLQAAKQVAGIKKKKKHAWWNDSCEKALTD